MDNSKDDKTKIDTRVEPFHLILSLPLFKSIKYNQGLQPDKTEIPAADIKEFDKFKFLFKEFLNKLNAHDSSAFTILSAIMNMWGYSRKYCGMCGKPIIGKPGHIENRMVCPSCNESYRITEALLRGDQPEMVSEERRIIPSKYHTKEKVFIRRNSPSAPPDSDPSQ